MEWWGWIVLGGMLLAAELTFLDVEFYLVFIGLSAAIVGVSSLLFPVPVWGQWLLFAAITVASVLLFRGRLYSQLRGDLPGYTARGVDQSFILSKELAPGAQTRAEFNGSTWTLRNNSGETIRAGTQVRVTRTEGIVLDVIPKT